MLYLLLDLLKLLARAAYALLKLLPTQNKVVLISRKSRTSSIDFRLIAAEIERTSPSTRVVILNHRMKHKFWHIFEIAAEMYHLATAKACVIDSYVISVSILNHKPELVVVQIWHALGAIKEFGHGVIGRKEGNSQRMADTMHMHRGYTHVIAGGEATIPIFAKMFNVDPSVIKPYGTPRVDYLVDTDRQAKNRQKIEAAYPQIKGKKVILYAPTFRKRGSISPQPLFDAVDYSQYALIFKQHDHDQTPVTKNPQLIHDTQFSVIQLLAAADYVVTDYSATAFEAAVLHKPLFFWAYDIDRYRKRRGLAMDYHAEMPGVVSTDPKRIVAAITKDEYNLSNIKKFQQKYVTHIDGTSSRKIVELLDL